MVPCGDPSNSLNRVKKKQQMRELACLSNSKEARVEETEEIGGQWQKMRLRGSRRPYCTAGSGVWECDPNTKIT